MRIRPWSLVVLLPALASCDTPTRHARIGDWCQANVDCASEQCDVDTNACAEPTKCVTDAMCEDADTCTSDVCNKATGQCAHTAIANCSTSGKTCACTDTGVKLDSSACTWPDKDQCSAWTSAVEFGDVPGDPAAAFPDHYKACWTSSSCCLTILCP